MKKKLRFYLLFFCLFLTSCNLITPPANSITSSLKFTLDFKEETFTSFEDVTATVTLTNIGNKDILVNKRLAFRVGNNPPKRIECYLLITDSSGKLISQPGHIDIEIPRSDNFIILPSGQSLKKEISLHGVGFFPENFNENEIYTVIAVYQNSLDVALDVNGNEVRSWIGEIQSNPDTFQIFP